MSQNPGPNDRDPHAPTPAQSPTPSAPGPAGYGQSPAEHGPPGPAPYGQAPAPYPQQPVPNAQQPVPYPQQPAPFGPPAAGYGPPSGPQPGPALSWAWSRFSDSAGAWIGGMLLWFLAMALALGLPLIPLVISLVNLTDAAAYGTTVPTGAIIGLVLSTLALIVLALLVGALMYSAVLSAARKAADGEKVRLGDVMRPHRVGSYLLLAILMSLISMVASIIPVVGTLAASYLFWFAPNAVVQEDRDGPIAGLGRSWTLTTTRLGDTVVGFLIAFGINVAGGLIIIGYIVTLPLTVLLQTYYFRRLQGRTVTPAA